MSAREITENLLKAIHSKKYGLIICNFANPDMVGHTGNFPATVAAIEIIDHCLAQIIAALKTVGGEAMITADHGNAERMYDDQTRQPHTAHTSELVPFVYIGRAARIVDSAPGSLVDIAPTLLYALGLPQPPEMTGRSLIKFD
jgi:2,3-bisphosphoglycerate-independent phosphoglycerate mutase